MTPQRLELLKAQVQQEMEVPIMERFSKLEEVSALRASLRRDQAALLMLSSVAATVYRNARRNTHTQV